MTVISPADGRETEQAVLRAAEYAGPVYIRLGRMAVEDVYDDSYVFEWGKGVLLREGKDIAIIATGIMVQEALKAHDILKEDGIYARVINIHTIKPLDKDIIISAAKETKAIVTAEEHSIIGGLGSAVLEALSDEYPIIVKRVGILDTFGESGKPKDLVKKYKLTAEEIVKQAKKALKML